MPHIAVIILHSAVLCCAVFAYCSVTAQVQKRVLIEQFTGAWCGWCVDGSYIMDNIIAANSGKVIGVKIHNNDAMEIPGITRQFGVGSYPCAAIDRKEFSPGVVLQNRDTWDGTTS